MLLFVAFFFMVPAGSLDGWMGFRIGATASL